MQFRIYGHEYWAFFDKRNVEYVHQDICLVMFLMPLRNNTKSLRAGAFLLIGRGSPHIILSRCLHERISVFHHSALCFWLVGIYLIGLSFDIGVVFLGGNIFFS